MLCSCLWASISSRYASCRYGSRKVIQFIKSTPGLLLTPRQITRSLLRHFGWSLAILGVLKCTLASCTHTMLLYISKLQYNNMTMCLDSYYASHTVSWMCSKQWLHHTRKRNFNMTIAVKSATKWQPSASKKSLRKCWKMLPLHQRYYKHCLYLDMSYSTDITGETGVCVWCVLVGGCVCVSKQSWHL